jgi:hypothetical protein
MICIQLGDSGGGERNGTSERIINLCVGIFTELCFPGGRNARLLLLFTHTLKEKMPNPLFNNHISPKKTF